jgi:hypothetical protein
MPSFAVRPVPDLDEILTRADVPLTTRIIDLNVLRIALRTNVPDFAGYSYFTRFADTQDTTSEEVDFWLDCVDLDHSPVDEQALHDIADQTFRGKRFRSGFYLTSYFGAPAYLVSRGNRFAVFGRQLERTVWPYFIKHILTAYGADRQMLHLKAAGFTDPAGQTTLLFGRGGAGKTVFLASACGTGMSFLTNTHVLLRDTQAFAIPSSMRIRNDALFAPLIREGGLDSHLEADEFMADPARLFPRTTDTGTVTNLCIVDHRKDRPYHMTPLNSDDAYDFLEQFAFAVSAYGLKDDLLAHHNGDFHQYVQSYARMKTQLRTLVDTTRTFHINMDLLDPHMRAEVLTHLSTDTHPAPTAVPS